MGEWLEKTVCDVLDQTFLCDNLLNFIPFMDAEFGPSKEGHEKKRASCVRAVTTALNSSSFVVLLSPLPFTILFCRNPHIRVSQPDHSPYIRAGAFPCSAKKSTARKKPNQSLFCSSSSRLSAYVYPRSRSRTYLCHSSATLSHTYLALFH